MSRKTLGVLVVCLGLALPWGLVAGCGTNRPAPTQAGKVEIVFWHSYVSSTKPALDKLLKRFEAEHPSIRLKAQYVQTGNALLQKLTTAISTNTAPDVCWIHKSWIIPLTKANSISDLDELAEQYGGFGPAERQDMFETPLLVSHYEGKLRMMPIEATNLVLAYNRDLFRKAGLDPDRPPRTWQEFAEMGKKLVVRKDGRVEQWACAVPIFTGALESHTVWHWKFFLWGEGGLFSDPSGEKVTFNSDAGVRALQFWVDLQHKYRIGTMTAPEQGFESQKMAMAFMGSWDLPHLRDLAFDWAVAPMPAGSVKRVSPLGGETLVVFRQTKHPKEAWEFLRWFISPAVQEQWSKDSGYLPIRKSVLQSPSYRAFLDKDPAFKVFAEEVPYGYAEPLLLPNTDQIDLVVSTALERAVRRVATPKQALDEAAVKCNAILAEARERERRGQPAPSHR